MTFGVVASSHPLAAVGYAATVLADSPLAYYRLGESSGTTMSDSSGNGRNGTYSDSPTLGTSGAITDGDTAATFAADGSLGTVTDAAWMDVDTFSIEFWFKKSSAPASSQMPVARYEIGTGRTAADNQHFQVVVDTDGHINFGVRNQSGTSYYAVSGTTNYCDGSWHHVVCTQTNDANPVRTIYVDGSSHQADSSSAFTVSTSKAAGLTIGARYDNDASPKVGNEFVGDLDEVAIYGTALSPARVAAHYNAA